MPFTFNPFTQNFDAVSDTSALDARLDILEAGASGVPQSFFKRKASDQNVTASTVLVNDIDLWFPAGADEIWEVEVIGGFQSASATPDAQIVINAPAGATGEQELFSLDTTATAVSGTGRAQAIYTMTGNSAGMGVGVIASGSGTVAYRLTALVIMGSTAGNVQVQFAQAVSNASSISHKAGARLSARRVYPATPQGANYGSFALVKRLVVGVNVAAPATDLDFSDLDLNSDSSYFVRFSLKNATASPRNISMYYNGDTTATNYNRKTSTAGSPSNDGIITAFDASNFVRGFIWIMKPATGDVATAIANYIKDASAVLAHIQTAHAWTSTNNPTSLRFTVAGVASCFADGSFVEVYRASPVSSQPLESIILAVPDNGVAITTGVAKLTFRMPYAFRLQTEDGVRGALTVAQASGSVLTFDVNKSGSSIFTTRPTFNNTEKTTKTAATPAVLNTLDLADDEEITINVDTVGTAGALGLKVALRGRRTI